MTLWLILTIMTSAAAVCLVVPLLRRAGPLRDETAGDIAVYRDQLQEVERDLGDGRIDAAQAETARTEIRRRILAAGAPQPAGAGLSGRERSIVIVSATVIVAVGSAVLYAAIGNPGVAAASRVAADGRTEGGRIDVGLRDPALPPQHPALDGLVRQDMAADVRVADSDGEPQAGLPTVEEMTRRLADRLARAPGDVEGWRTLGWSYLNIGRFDAAAAAYGKAIALDPGNMEFRGGRIEALVGAASGVVTPEARAEIEDVLRRDPKDGRARYFAGLASEQDGDKAAAVATWTGLLADAGAHVDESLASDLRSRVSDLKRGLGQGGSSAAVGPAEGPGQGAEVGPKEGSNPAIADRGPSRQDVQAAEAMPPADRQAMIRGMVDGLARRLERAPRDADGWIKLMRSRAVLGDGALAQQALARGLAAFADDAAERDRISAAAQELGVGR
jgi:cytochrome c-type biogenesis protein CcmH